jgi:hypothetical protein
LLFLLKVSKQRLKAALALELSNTVDSSLMQEGKQWGLVTRDQTQIGFVFTLFWAFGVMGDNTSLSL